MTEEKPADSSPEKPAPPLTPEDVPLTREELVAKLEQLSARAKAAGISPLQMMAQAYAKRGLAILDGFLSALEESPPQKPTSADTKKTV